MSPINETGNIQMKNGLTSILRFVPKHFLWNIRTAKNNRNKRRIFIGSEKGLVPIKITSQRYRLFERSLICVSCGKIGNVLSVDQRETENGKPLFHLNLYHIDGEEITLMTKDHIIPKSKRGPNHQDNYQVMCQPCNQKKGNKTKEEINHYKKRKKRKRQSCNELVLVGA